MKANQAFVNNEEAVSPVIGVILMVAITVVLAAVVFVLVSDLGGDTENTPTMSFDKDETANTLNIISASDADWGDIAGSGCTAFVDADNDNTADAAEQITGASGGLTGAVTAGTLIEVETADLPCTLSLNYEPSNALLGSWEFEA